MPEGQGSATGERSAEHARQDDDRQSQSKDNSQSNDEQKPEKHSRWPLIALGIAIILAIIGGVIYWLLTKDQVSTDDAYTDGRAVMIAPQVSGYVT